MVVGGRLHRRNLEKQLKKRNQSHLFCDVIDDVSPMSHASSESDLNFDNLGRLSQIICHVRSLNVNKSHFLGLVRVNRQVNRQVVITYDS